MRIKKSLFFNSWKDSEVRAKDVVCTWVKGSGLFNFLEKYSESFDPFGRKFIELPTNPILSDNFDVKISCHLVVTYIGMKGPLTLEFIYK